MSKATTAGSQAGHDLFEGMNIEYETAYGYNPLKRACVAELLSLLPPSSSILDIGTGTGKPVASTLAEAGHRITGTDISPKMLEIARAAVPNGTFIEADLVAWDPLEKPDRYDAVIVMFCHLQLTAWGDFHTAMYRLAEALNPGGYFVIGTMVADKYVKEEDEEWAYDSSGTYCVDYPAPFMGKMVPTFFLTQEGMTTFVESMGLEIVYDETEMFHPDHPTAVGEEQQYIIARRRNGEALKPPMPLPEE